MKIVVFLLFCLIKGIFEDIYPFLLVNSVESARELATKWFFYQFYVILGQLSSLTHKKEEKDKKRLTKRSIHSYLSSNCCGVMVCTLSISTTSLHIPHSTGGLNTSCTEAGMSIVHCNNTMTHQLKPKHCNCTHIKLLEGITH